MKIELIEEFLVFAKKMNFSRAAEELCMTQPGLSKHMADLERELGVTLIDRETNGKDRTSLTPAGKLFFEECSTMIVKYHQILDKVKAIHREGPRKIVISELLQNYAMSCLYPIVRDFKKTHNDFFLEMYPLRGIGALEALRKGQFDVILDTVFGEDSETYVEALEKQGMAAVLFASEKPIIWFEKGHRKLSELGRITPADLAQVPLLSCQGKSYDYVSKALEDSLKRSGYAPLTKWIQLMDATSPSSMFLQEFGDAYLATSSFMKNDLRLSIRDDLECRVLEDECFRMDTYVVANEGDEEGMVFFDHVKQVLASHACDCLEAPET